MQENVNSANYNSSIIHMYEIASFTQRQGIFLSLPLGTSFHGYTKKLPRETVFFASTLTGSTLPWLYKKTSAGDSIFYFSRSPARTFLGKK